jgi:hypothetical protein
MAFDLSAIGSGVGGLVSLGTGIEGAVLGSRSASDAARDQRAIAQLDIQADQQRKAAMELSARRQMTENVRNAQMARSMALTNATGQGAAYGESSGLRGGYASISGQAGVNQQGISQNLQIGENLFDINAQVDAAKMELAKDQSGEAMAQGIASLGGSIGKSLGPIGSLFQSLPGFLAV